MVSLLVLSLLFIPAQSTVSQFYFADEFNVGTTQLNFDHPHYVFVASSGRNDDNERDISVTDDNVTIPITEAAKQIDGQGYLQPVFAFPVSSMKVERLNPRQRFRGPAIIYVVDERQGLKVVAVQKEPITIELKKNTTLLSPRGVIKIDAFGDNWTPVTVSAGGAEEARSSQFTLHGLGSALTRRNPPLLVFEPLLTIHKQLPVSSGVTFNVSCGGDFENNTIELKADWDDQLVAMSPGYRLWNSSSSINYEIKTGRNYSEFSVRLTGDIPEASQLAFKHNELGGGSVVTEGLAWRSMNSFLVEAIWELATNEEKLTKAPDSSCSWKFDVGVQF